MTDSRVTSVVIFGFICCHMWFLILFFFVFGWFDGNSNTFKSVVDIFFHCLYEYVNITLKIEIDKLMYAN